MLSDYLRHNLRTSGKKAARDPAPARKPQPKTNFEKLMEMADIGAQLEENESCDPYNRSVESYLREHPTRR